MDYLVMPKNLFHNRRCLNAFILVAAGILTAPGLVTTTALANPKLDKPARVCGGQTSVYPPGTKLSFPNVLFAKKYQINIQLGEQYQHYSNRFRTIGILRIEEDSRNPDDLSARYEYVDEGIYWFKVRALEAGEFDQSDWYDPLPITYNKQLKPIPTAYESVYLSTTNTVHGDTTFDREK